MASIFDELQGMLAGSGIDKMASMLGVDASQVQGAVGASLPALLEGLKRNASTPEGADALHKALAKDHDGGLLDADDLVGSLDVMDGQKILGHLFGDKTDAVTSQLAGASGGNAGLFSKLLPMLAPLVMGWLGRQQNQKGITSGGLGDLLGGLAGGGGGGLDMGSLLGSVLGGGSGGGLGDMVGQVTGATQSGSSGLMGMLKKLLGRR